MKRIYKIPIWLFILSMTLGFRIFPGSWDISRTDPTVWIRLCNSSILVEENDITETDPLAGVTALTMTQVVQSVIDDYNSIPTSYVRLAFYPADPNNPGAPLAGDSVFTLEKGQTRTIDICFDGTDSTAGLSGGHAQAKYQGGKIIGCEIKTKSEYTEKAKFLTHLLTHEIGHCFGLMHPQESVNSVMSYFNKSEPFLRLQNDDYAGITYRYPEDESYSREQSTFGLTGCSPK